MGTPYGIGHLDHATVLAERV
ncbi:uncharacterized protein G2W53_015312 [Senna tora]|uniref:Uncharacterized protein n=1 Tax=Senna tora TaxID=362788 RepID=A0A835C5F1_9FABA|nr:uncharacterized protein G2W53_015312 [Senna tora]